jgi:hypothetical protein
MPIPVYNIINYAGLDPKNMGNIQNSPTNVNKIKNSLRGMWVNRIINDNTICQDLIDYTGAPDWIREAIDQERLAIQGEIKQAN